MKVLTLHQPYASLIALGVKTIETRSWSTQYRGPLAIHAAARKPDVEMLEDGLAGDTEWGQWFETPVEDFYPPAPPAENRWTIALAPGYAELPMPLGAIVAICTLVDVVPMVGVCVGTGQHVVVTDEHLDLHAGYTQQGIDSQRPYGDYTPGRYAWLLADVVPVDPPVPFRGGQGLTKTWEP